MTTPFRIITLERHPQLRRRRRLDEIVASRRLHPVLRAPRPAVEHV